MNGCLLPLLAQYEHLPETCPLPSLEWFEIDPTNVLPSVVVGSVGWHATYLAEVICNHQNKSFRPLNNGRRLHLGRDRGLVLMLHELMFDFDYPEGMWSQSLPQ